MLGLYQVPGMLSNFITQLSEQNALDKLDEVLAEVPRVREDFGNPPLVTPSSQIVGSQAVLNVLAGERYKMVTSEVKNYMKGLYGQAPGQVNEEVRKKIIGDIEPVTVRPADLIPPQMEEAKKEIGDLAKNEEELLMYVLFPQVAKPFLEGTLEPEVIKVEEKKEVEKVVEAPQKEVVQVHKFASSLKKMQKGGNITINLNGNIEKLKIMMDGSDFAFDLQEGAAKPVMASKEALGQVAATKEDVLEGEPICTFTWESI